VVIERSASGRSLADEWGGVIVWTATDYRHPQGRPTVRGMELPRHQPRSTVKVIGGLALALIVMAFVFVQCVRLYVRSAPKPTLAIPRAELLVDVPKFYPITALGAAGTQTHGVWVTLRRDGSAIALISRDPRRNCFVPWRTDFTFDGTTGWYRDPCGGSTYGKDGVAVFGPTPRGLDHYISQAGVKTVTVDLSRVQLGQCRMRGSDGTPTPARLGSASTATPAATAGPFANNGNCSVPGEPAYRSSLPVVPEPGTGS
jgi:hypothetical protein